MADSKGGGGWWGGRPHPLLAQIFFSITRLSRALHKSEKMPKRALQTLYKHRNNSETWETTPRINGILVRLFEGLREI